MGSQSSWNSILSIIRESGWSYFKRIISDKLYSSRHHLKEGDNLICQNGCPYNKEILIRVAIPISKGFYISCKKQPLLCDYQFHPIKWPLIYFKGIICLNKESGHPYLKRILSLRNTMAALIWNRILNITEESGRSYINKMLSLGWYKQPLLIERGYSM